MPLHTRYFSFDDVTPDQGWALLEWCQAHGGAEFTIDGLVVGRESHRMRAFFQDLQPEAMPPAPRRRLSAAPGTDITREVELWQLTHQTVECLRQTLPMGFVTTTYQEGLWLEDLTVYRDGDFLMGVLTHESAGVLRITELELGELRAMGFPDKDSVAWIGF